MIQPRKRCCEDSSESWHITQFKGVNTPLLDKLVLVGILSMRALHAVVSTFGKALACQRILNKLLYGLQACLARHA